ncbi:MAG: DegT/DnrJ/EryC1/StrS family aminotransferase [bacterium]|nr:DegT/DnrJ/EryC1/StrS family aminotransferase [bacterium]
MIKINRPWLPSVFDIEEDLKRIFSSGIITCGPYVKKFEERIGEYIGKEAVCVSSCTSGLILLLKAIGLSGSVIIPSFTFSATAISLLWCGIEPIFVDCLEGTFCIDYKKVEEAIREDTSGILAVYTFGNPPDIDRLQEIAERKSLCLIFDSAQGFGSIYKGRKAGNFGKAEVFSLSPTKLVSAQEGGVILTDDAELARKLCSLRDYGRDGENFPYLGMSARMTEINAVIGIRSLNTLNERLTKIKAIVQQYKDRLSSLVFQEETEGAISNYNYIGVRIQDREKVWSGLLKKKVETKRYFCPPLHKQPIYKDNTVLPVTEMLSKEVLCLPLHSYLSEKEIDKICRELLALL